MKAQGVTQEQKNFKPITIQITFETEAELAEFYARHRAAHAKIVDSYPTSYNGSKVVNTDWEAFNVVKKYFQ